MSDKDLITSYNETVGNLNEWDGYDCKICKNKGVVFVAVETEFGSNIIARKCVCEEIRATLKALKASGLVNVEDFSFEKYQTPEDWQKHIKEAGQAFVNDEAAHWFYIGGQTGAGKTHICTAITKHYIDKGYSCRYMPWRETAVKLKALANDRAYSEKIAPYKNARVLYIDDFLKCKSGTDPTPADVNLAFELLNYRLGESDKITVISSEFTIRKALEFDEATISRIYHKAGKYKLNIEKDMSKNYRLKEV